VYDLKTGPFKNNELMLVFIRACKMDQFESLDARENIFYNESSGNGWMFILGSSGTGQGQQPDSYGKVIYRQIS
jgi:hypothetical protein